MLIVCNNELIPEMGVLYICDFKIVLKLCQPCFIKIKLNIRLIDYVYI